MSMLDRYRKTGGFVQLLNLLETCGPVKQEKFLQIIRDEDPVWASVIETKILTFDRIFKWPPEAIAEIVGCLQELTIAICLHGLNEQQCVILRSTLNNSITRRVQDLFDTNKPSPGEISTMLTKFMTETRKLITENRLRMDKIDPQMYIDDDIEDQLKRGTLRSVPKATATGAAAPAAQGSAAGSAPAPAALNFDMADHLGAVDGANKEEIIVLRRKIATLTGENNQLKSEISSLKAKIEQIRRAAA